LDEVRFKGTRELSGSGGDDAVEVGESEAALTVIGKIRRRALADPTPSS
jgi:hypothetical protein